MSDKTSKQKSQLKQIRQANILEALKDLGGGVGRTLVDDVAKETGSEFMRQLLGLKAKQKISGDIQRGESLVVSDAMSGKKDVQDKQLKQVRFEKRILEEEKAVIESKNHELQLRLHAIAQEIQGVVISTPKLARQVEVASLTATNAPGIYHVMFLEKILEFLKSFKENIESASAWLGATNKRANKKNFWNQYKVQKGTALLNPETYNQRSAG